MSDRRMTAQFRRIGIGVTVGRMLYAICHVRYLDAFFFSVQCVPRAPSVAAGQKAHTHESCKFAGVY